MSRLPETLEDFKALLGLEIGQPMNLDDIRAAQEKLYGAFLDAAIERWPDQPLTGSDAQCTQVTRNAFERWPFAKNLAEALNAAERHILEEWGRRGGVLA